VLAKLKPAFACLYADAIPKPFCVDIEKTEFERSNAELAYDDAELDPRLAKVVPSFVNVQLPKVSFQIIETFGEAPLSANC
jgi:hypothetical protein